MLGAYLIVGLGNPGSRYDGTRHNIGFHIVDVFASASGTDFRSTPRVKGMLAKGDFEIGKVFLLKPETYMNLSGESVRACVDYYKIPLENILIVTDDVHLPFGTLRFRPRGSSGGHNGLENIEQHLNTNHYPRLRVGVGQPADSDMASFVLEKFKPAEKKQMEDFTIRTMRAIEHWLENGMTSAMNQFNIHPKQRSDNGRIEKKPL